MIPARWIQAGQMGGIPYALRCWPQKSNSSCQTGWGYDHWARLNPYSVRGTWQILNRCNGEFDHSPTEPWTYSDSNFWSKGINESLWILLNLLQTYNLNPPRHKDLQTKADDDAYAGRCGKLRAAFRHKSACLDTFVFQKLLKIKELPWIWLYSGPTCAASASYQSWPILKSNSQTKACKSRSPLLSRSSKPIRFSPKTLKCCWLSLLASGKAT